ncbi:PIN domain-like protein [Mycena pura]|uniref:PIN domain-like protein n=1 Tax=Mycena pura TaxID=153505 RepID=A0AAD6YKY1_9AGAR|nr:PIN domain-like protein [Mycena pura]
MGINNLWTALSAIEEKVSLHHLAVSTGFIGNSTGARGFRVGIDASGWIYRAVHKHGYTESPELVALFARCSRLFQLPFIPIFVFDGPGRPNVKRGKRIRRNDHWLTGHFQQMLNAFGYLWIVAPGEAEATLAVMTTDGVPVRVDAILTDDSDSFVFGASTVLRIRSEDNKNYEASMYSAHDIAQVLGLQREDFILIALLVGGDYSDGLDQCGIVTAIGLAQAGLGRQLISGIAGKSDAQSSIFLQIWQQSLRSELMTNASGRLPHKSRRLALQIPQNFPDLDVINLYLRPLVSGAIPDLVALSYQPPCLDLLAHFAEDHFIWGNHIGILDHFVDHIFGGLVIRELVQQALILDGFHPPVTSSSLIKQIVGERRAECTGGLAELRLVVDLEPGILVEALKTLSGRRNPRHAADAVDTWISKTLPKVRVWAPKSMVEHVYRALVLDYVCAQAKPSRRKTETKQPPIASSSKTIEGPTGKHMSFIFL